MNNKSLKPPKNASRAVPALSSPTLHSVQPLHSPTSHSNPVPNLTHINDIDGLPALSSPSDRFKDVKIPKGWLECPLEFTQPHRDYRILVCKTPIDLEIAQCLKIPKDKYFAPHTIYTLPTIHYIQKQQQISPHTTPKHRKVGLVIDLTNQMYYDEISFNNGKKQNKVIRRVITMQNIPIPTQGETSGFVGLVKSFLDSANNQDKWIVVHDDLGYNLSGFMCSAFLVKELNYSVDAAVHTFAQSRRPGIFDPIYIRLLHELYSDKEDQQVFEQMLKLKPLSKPRWMRNHINNKPSQFAVPTTSIRRKRSFSEMNKSRNNNTQRQHNVLKENNQNMSSLIIEEPSLLSEPKLIQDHSRSSDIIMEPKLIGSVGPPLIVEPPSKKRKPQVFVPRELKQDHGYLVAVGDQHLQHLTTIALQLSKNKDIFRSIQCKPATVPRSSLMAIKENYRISWLGAGYMFWLMILGKRGCFFVDPSYFDTGKLGGIYHIGGTQFHDEKNNKYLDGTLCCGELVLDHIGTNKQSKVVPRFLITDMLVFDRQSLSSFPHTERLMRAENKLYKPFAKSLQRSKLRIRVKPMYNIEGKEIIDKLQRMIDNELPHKCNGLGLFPIKPPYGQRILRIAL